MKHRVYLSACGAGYGHSSRVLAIATELKKRNVSVVLGSYDYVLERFKKSGFSSVKVRKEFEMTGDKGAFSLAKTIRQSGGPVLSLTRTISDEKKIMKKRKITCVVADGRYTPIFAAAQLGIPCLIVANQTTLFPFFAKGPFFVKFIGKSLELTSKTSTTIAEETLIPDLPPPYTVCINTLSKDKSVMKRQRFVGPLVAQRKVKPIKYKHPLVLVMPGGHPYRKPLFDAVIGAAQKMPNVNFIIFTTFKTAKQPKNVLIYEFVKDNFPYLLASDLVITQGGHSTAMELITFGKTAIIVPDKGQIEQERNASRMRDLGVAELLTYDKLSVNRMTSLIRKMLSNKKYQRRAKYFEKYSKRMNGPKTAADVVIELSKRIQIY